MKKENNILLKETNEEYSSDLLFGTNAEHMGRIIYGGIYDPESKLSDENGFRNDVKEAIKDLNLSSIRYPGGNFVSGYNFRDAIGKNRPKTLNLAWFQLEPNTIGLHENYNYYTNLGVPTQISLNLGLASIKESVEFFEYCEFNGDSTLANLRAENGNKEPFGTKQCYLGNEMDGWWQMGNMKPAEYGRKANEVARLVKKISPKVQLIVCGTAKPTFKWYVEGEKQILNECYENVDMISMHTYFDCPDYYKYIDKSDNEYIGVIAEVEKDINRIFAAINEIKKKKNSKKQVYISFDEWNIWHRGKEYSDANDFKVESRRLECPYDFRDALLFANFLCVLLENNDKIKIASQAQLLNTIGLFMTNKEGLFKQTIYYPYQFAGNHLRGTSVKLSYNHEYLKSKSFGKYDKYRAVLVKGENEKSILAVNNSPDESKEFSFEVDATAKVKLSSLMQAEMTAKNSFENPNNVVPKEYQVEIKDGKLCFVLPPASFAMISLEVANNVVNEEAEETSTKEVVYC